MKDILQDEFNAVLLNAPDSNIVRIENDDHYSLTVVWFKSDCVWRVHRKLEDLTSYHALK